VRLSGKPEQLRQALAVEAHDDLAVDQDGRRRVDVQAVQLVVVRLVLRDVALLEGNPVLAKELLRPAAEGSPGLRVDDHLLRHGSPPRAALIELPRPRFRV
jgi:hypothetical protein